MMKSFLLIALLLSTLHSFAGGYGTKYVICGWDIGRAGLQTVADHAAELNNLPIAGLSCDIMAKVNGIELTSDYIWNDPEWTAKPFEEEVEKFRQIVAYPNLKHSFMRCGMAARRTEGVRGTLGGKKPRIRFDDDANWTRIAHNYRTLARIAKKSGVIGLLIDNEDYHGTKQFEWLPEDNTSWDEAQVLARRRGREVFKAIFDEFPDIRLLFYWAFSNVRLQATELDPHAALKASRRLFPAFLNGLLDVMPPEAVMIDGDEDAYTFRAADGTFEKTFVTILSDMLVFVAPENRAKYRAQVRNSFGLYLDQYVGAKYRRRGGKRGVPNNWYRPPLLGSRDAAFREDLEAATRAADEYVWLYGERYSYIDWGNALDGLNRPWSSLYARQTWDERLGLSTKLAMTANPRKFLETTLPKLKADPKADNIFARGITKKHPSVTVWDAHEQVTNRNYFIVTVETKGTNGVPVLRWRKDLNWNWEPGGVRKNELVRQGETDDGWTIYGALVRVPVDANNAELQVGAKNEARAAGFYRVDAPPTRPHQLAYQLDISRDKVPTMESLKRIVDIIASLGYTQFQLYMECAFAYKGYENVWKDRSPMTGEEMRELSAYCRRKGIDLVPSQNTFAHMAPWFEEPTLLRKLAECPNGANIDLPTMKKKRGPVTLVASGGESLRFVEGLFDQLLSCAESRYLNIGCDEVYDLWDKNCRSAAKVAKDGYARTYMDHVLAVATLARVRQREAMFWADAIFDHPELSREIPKDMIALVYGYGGEGDRFDAKCRQLADDEVRFYVCPGTSGWCGPSGRTKNMMANIKEAFDAGRCHGAEGMMVCDWGDGGHHQPWIVALPSLVYAAALVQGRDLTRAEIAAKIDEICGAEVGAALLRYGDVYETTSYERFIFNCYAGSKSEKIAEPSLAIAREAKGLLRLDGAPDWVKEDFQTIDFLYRLAEAHAKGRTPDWEKIESVYRKLWLRQNRDGGFARSLQKLKTGGY